VNKIVGVISDTHGLLRPEVLGVFAGVSLILHAGDIGSSEVLRKLQALARTIAVRGNNDHGAWAKKIPEVVETHVGHTSVCMIHDLKQIGERALAAGFDVIISGHSHRPSIERRDSTLFLNPGSAGPRRFKLPISVARLVIERSVVDAELIQLQTGER
jgi:putative phosphoesterase